MTDAMKKIIAARTTIVLDEPFFGTLCHMLKPIEDASIPTLCTDGKVVRFNPDFVTGRDAWTNIVDLCHEVTHVYMGHIWRAQELNHEPKRSNRAADYVTNAVLRDTFKRLPAGYLYDAKYNGMSYEQVYNTLRDEDNEDEDGNEPGNEPCGPGEFTKAPADEVSTLEAEWQVATLQAAAIAKACGKLPGSLEDLIKSMKETRVDWRSALMRWAQQQSKSDYSWTRRNKRYSDVYLPGQHSYEMGEMVIGVDVSGSCLHALPSFAHAVNAIVDAVKPLRVHVVYVDTEVSGADTFEQGESVTFNVRGGGGTRFEPLFDYITEHGIEPACVVYLTDLEAGFDFTPPNYPLLWACTEKTVAPFGETLHIGGDL